MTRPRGTRGRSVRQAAAAADGSAPAARWTRTRRGHAEPTAVVVLGMHRAGTSAVAGALAGLGVEFGNRLVPGAPLDNEKGFWEHRDVVAVHDQLLLEFGSAWHDIRPLPRGWLESLAAREAQAALLHILERDFESSEMWGVKDPRMCRLMPLWSLVFERLQAKPRFILVWRSPADAIASLARRDGFSTARGAGLWLTHMLGAEAATRGLPRAVLRYEDLMSDWARSIDVVAERLAVQWPTPPATAAPRVTEFLDRSLWHHRSPPVPPGATGHYPLVSEVADLLERVDTDGPRSEARLSTLASQVETALDLFGHEMATASSEPEMAQLYLPGETYTEERSIRARLAANSPEVVSFAIPAGALSGSATFRFDPAANVGLISIRRVRLRDTDGHTVFSAEGRELDGTRVGGTSFRLPEDFDGLRVLSYGDDPHLFVQVTSPVVPDLPLVLEVDLQVDRSGSLFPAYVRWLRAQHAAEHALVERVADEDLALLRSQRDSAATAAAELATRNGILDSSVASLTAQMASLAESTSALEHRALAAEQQTKVLRSQVDEQQQAKDALDREMDLARARAGELARELEASREHVAQLTRHAEELALELHAHRSRVADLAVQATDRESRITALSADLGAASTQLTAVSMELARIRQSSLWAAAQRLQGVAARVAPVGTARFRAVKLLGAVLRVVATDGLAQAVRRAAGIRGRLRVRREWEQHGLFVRVDTPMSQTVDPGKRTAVRVAGWCYHPSRRVRKLWLVLDGRRVRAEYGMTRADVYAAHHPLHDPHGHSLNSGFEATVALPAAASDAIEVRLGARLSGGLVVEVPLGSLTVARTPPPPAERLSPALGEESMSGRPLVAICMATHNPPLDLFKAQVASLVAQTYANWICVVSDDCSRPDLYENMRELLGTDPRMHVFRNPDMLGFYGNFEAALRRVPPEAAFVCLADQDDAWHADKLDTLLRGFRPETQLVYSDMNIRDERGTLVSSTYWTTRRNNYTSLESLLLANTVTGAASMFRRALLDPALPFPARIGDSFHDHWIACVALTKGSIGYVDRPLHDYIQHGTQVLGHTAPRARGPLSKLSTLVRRGLRMLVSRVELSQFVHHGRMIYWNDVSRIKLIAATLLERVPEAPSAKRAVLRRYATLDRSAGAWARLAARGLRELAAVKETTVLAELRLLHGLVAQGLFGVRQAMRRPRRAAAQAARAMLGESRAQVEGALARVELIEQKVAPLRLAMNEQAPRRINLLIPTVDFQVFFGGYIAKFQLALRLSREGHRVRVVVVDHCDFNPPAWRRHLEGFDELSGVLDAVEFAYAFDRSRPLEVNPGDAFVASTWWTAHIAHHAARELNGRRFLYLVQEYEPFTFSMGTHSALALESYSFPHHALFSTELLRDYFEQNGLGVFQPGALKAGARALWFRNAITDVGCIRSEDLAGRRPRRLLFYARPEAHASRNMFEMGVLALCRAIAQGAFDDGDWEFYGIGSAGPAAVLPLAGGRTLRMLPRVGQADYARLLRAHDVGLALMFTPHPSLVPLEMASAGLVVVTNTYANKTRAALEAISGNIVAVPPSAEGVVAGLFRAVRRVDDHAFRAREASVRWARHWAEAFPPGLMAALGEVLETLPPSAPALSGSRSGAGAPLRVRAD